MMVVVLCTIPAGKSEELADKIINERLAGCINIIPGVKSIYHWKGNVERDTEDLMVIKTQKILFDKLKEFIKQNHPYTVPEIVAINVENVNNEYLEWLLKETRV
ncbi:MAG: divalent-cation tolerance protein CutA [Spirochaetia bacterium]|nr:divalent-cation tolerance protein CutA [Spirochaetota bacterium]MCX8096355.1 divalent-cation tolerance protein CutA [Spirochaetota bacterium]MDW8112284.1 divalent-cation tolerance protein CutA [Spirochaetia bacterium]